MAPKLDLSGFKEKWSQFSEKIAEQEWAQEIKSKWEELDNQSRTYLKGAFTVIGILGATVLLLVFWLSVRSVRNEYREKQELLALIRGASDEMRTLRESSASLSIGGGDEMSWDAYADGVANLAGIDRSALTVGAEKKGDSLGDSVTESLFDITLKKINVKQLVRFAFHAENGGRPVKLRNLAIDTHPDASGYLDATLSLSGFKSKSP